VNAAGVREAVVEGDDRRMSVASSPLDLGSGGADAPGTASKAQIHAVEERVSVSLYISSGQCAAAAQQEVRCELS
jgi:hypothetical protein